MSNPIKPNLKTEILPLGLTLLSFLVAIYFYFHFPDRVPSHWNFKGEVDGYSGPFWAAFLVPLMMIAMYIMFFFLPYFDPKKEDYAKFAPTYHKFKSLIVVFLFVLFILTGINGLGYKINIGLLIPLIVGVLFAIIGSLLNKIKMNWFMGIRTPWTMSSEAVWNKTHAVSGKVLMFAGILFAITAFLPGILKIIGFVLALVAIIFGLPIYSYYLYRQEKKGKKI